MSGFCDCSISTSSLRGCCVLLSVTPCALSLLVVFAGVYAYLHKRLAATTVASTIMQQAALLWPALARSYNAAQPE